MSAMGHTGTNKKEKGQVGHDLASLRKLTADSKFGRRIYFAYFGAGVITSSFLCAQAPSPKEVTSTATIMITFKNFNLSRLLSEQVAALF